MDTIRKKLETCSIEDPALDIADLDDAIDKTTPLGLQAVYRNLKNVSENHLRAVVAALARLGQQYTPQYIGQEEFDAIIAR